MNKILIHGLGQDASSWKQTVSKMEKKNEVVCLELLSTLEGKEVNYPNLYHAFSDYCDSVNEKLDLCGLSLGAVLALKYATEHPQKIHSLVLIAGQYKMPKLLLKMQNIIFRLMPKAVFDKIGLTKRDALKLTRSMMTIDLTDNLKKVVCPTLILCGEQDKTNRKSAIEMHRCIETSEIQFIQNAKHEVNMDVPAELAKILNDFYR